MKNILVLNPNSSPAVTDRMRRGCDGLDLHPEHRVSFHELADGPPVIETQRHVEAVTVPVCDFLAAHPADAYVIGCFSDPGLYLAREEIEAPVLGIAECAYREAAALGRRFGIVSISATSVARHARAVQVLGLAAQLAGDRPLDLGVLDLLDEDRAVERIVEVGIELRDRDGADALVLGCATMGAYRPRVEAALRMPVVDPTQAAVVRASALLSFRRAPSLR